MANFTTHIAVGTVVAGALSTLTLAADVVPHESLIAVTLACVLGSVLPDIDLKDSRPSRALFAGLGIAASFIVLFSFAGIYSIAELWFVWLGTLVGVRYGLHAIFHRISVHRGIWHSILATIFCSIVTAIVFKYILGQADGIAWLGGGFLAIGYLTHLVLDELYSVDVMDSRLKASFGTALKFADIHRWRDSVAMAIGVAAALAIAPPPASFVQGITSKALWSNLESRLLPHDSWFGLIDVHHAIAHTPLPAAQAPGSVATASPSTGAQLPSSSPLTTGSLPDRSPVRTIENESVTPR